MQHTRGRWDTTLSSKLVLILISAVLVSVIFATTYISPAYLYDHDIIGYMRYCFTFKHIWTSLISDKIKWCDTMPAVTIVRHARVDKEVNFKLWMKQQRFSFRKAINVCLTTQIAKFMGPTWGPPWSCWPQMGPMLAPWTLISGYRQQLYLHYTPLLMPSSAKLTVT